jgi:hypothetical protein
MRNDELKSEMKVRVDHDGALKPAKVIGPVRVTNAGTGKLIEISGWVVAIDASNLHVTVTAEKIHPRS